MIITVEKCAYGVSGCVKEAWFDNADCNLVEKGENNKLQTRDRYEKICQKLEIILGLNKTKTKSFIFRHQSYFLFCKFSFTL